MMQSALSLYELNQLVRETLETTLDRAYWVEAELSEAREVNGHCYMELIQKDAFTNTPVAKASAKCWRSVWTRVRPKFEQVTGQRLHVSMKVMLQVYANFHEAYGFSWIVTDINPEYTLGDMARKRKEIVRQLKQEGVFDLQRELPLPLFTQRIAVVSSVQAAGYGDFCRQLAENEYGLVFYTRLFPAVMQGEGVEDSVVSALNSIYNCMDRFDAVVIIRGGGATSDLSGFDTLALAENVANFPLPIITGIGHDRDESVLDMVSHTRVKTPTAAAAFLVNHAAHVLARIDETQQRVVAVVARSMELEQMKLRRVAEQIPLLFSMVKMRQSARIERVRQQFTAAVQHSLMQASHRLDRLAESLPTDASRRLTGESYRLDILARRVAAVDPMLLLRRGYSITYHNGRAVRQADSLKSGDEIETRLLNGTIKSTIK